MVPDTYWLNVADYPPTEVGWYATVTCWDVDEGFIPGALFWDGKQWSRNYPVVQRSLRTFAGMDLAKIWAYEHDPEQPSTGSQGSI